MKIIGEKINGTRKAVKQAVLDRDVEFIQRLAVAQADAGATWIDVNAGTPTEREPDDLVWLVQTVQAAVTKPLCLDSANPAALSVAIQLVKKTPMINSISGEPERLSGILPIVAEHGCQVIALALDEKKIPETSEKRLQVIDKIIGETRARGVADSQVYIDPLAMTLSTDSKSALTALETMQAVKQAYPEAHLTIGLSNISFGLPARSFVNRYFLSLAIAHGLDCAILDPLDREIQAAIVTSELLLGQDDYCLKYIKASRKGLFDKPTE